jgi:predicted lipoprotein with Yx(FWY)xxD motif
MSALYVSIRTLAVAATLAATVAAAETTPPARVEAGVLVGNNGMTLYVFDKDSAGKSVCNGPCATNWPPLMAGGGDQAAGNWSILNRDDGGKQWAYKGKPLYFWSKDQKPGDKTGDGFSGVWHIAQ